MLPETENEPTSFITQEQCDALAERIATVLRERKKIGAERLMRSRMYHRADVARCYKERGEVRKELGRRTLVLCSAGVIQEQFSDLFGFKT